MPILLSMSALSFFFKHVAKAFPVPFIKKIVARLIKKKRAKTSQRHTRRSQDHASAEPPDLPPKRPETTPYHTGAAAPAPTLAPRPRTRRADYLSPKQRVQTP
jgi:hypothetical protein